jgi:hypothetical protein
MIRRSALVVLGLLSLSFSNGQTVQKCCGTSNSTFLLGNLSTANHSQCIYTPGDLTGEVDGSITRIYYRYGTTGQALGNTLTNFMVRMVQTAATAFVGGNTFFTGLDTVLTSASYTIAPGATGDWFTIELDSTFIYDASLTLVVDISFTGSATTNFGTYSTNMAGRKLYWSDLTSPTGESVVTTWQDIGFDLAPVTEVAEVGTDNMLFFPNPVTHTVHLTGIAPNTAYRLLSTDGRIVRTGTASSSGIPVADLVSGTYLIGVLVDNTWRYERIVKE